MKRVIVLCAAAALSGCMGMSVKDMTPEQIKATNGMVTCASANSIYGKATLVTVNNDDVRKGNAGGAKVTVNPDCSVSVENTTAPGAVNTVPR